MLYITWTDKNNLGIQIIDEQHRGIVSTINSLYHFVQQGRGMEILKPTLNILEQYSIIHFKTEEELIKNSDFPAVKDHITLHQNLIKRMKSLSDESIWSQDSEMILRFLKEWWLGHISQEDRKYAPYVIKNLK